MAGLAPAASARSLAPAAHATGTGGAWHTNLTVLKNQLGSPGVYSIVSQDFTDAGFDVYDSFGADDFAVPSTLTRGWKVQGIRAVGLFFNGAGPCDSETAVFYADSAGSPGAALATRTGTGTLTGMGTYTLALAPAVLLAKGKTYWVSFYCTMAYGVGGEWGWSDRTVLTGTAAKWENPGDGFASGCVTWGDMNTCIGISGEPDFQYALVGGAR